MESIEAQVNYAVLLERFEEAVSGLYKEYARLFPGHRVWWQHLAAEEIQHAEWMRTLRARIQDGSVRLSERQTATTGQILEALDLVAAEVERATQGDMTLAMAVSAAAQLERKIVERDWFRFFDADSPELKRVFQSLGAETAKHAEFLQQMSQEQATKARESA